MTITNVGVMKYGGEDCTSGDRFLSQYLAAAVCKVFLFLFFLVFFVLWQKRLMFNRPSPAFDSPVVGFFVVVVFFTPLPSGCQRCCTELFSHWTSMPRGISATL